MELQWTAKPALTLRSPPTPGAPVHVWKCRSRCWRRWQLLISQTSISEATLIQTQRCCESNLKGEKYHQAGLGNENFSGSAGGQQPNQGSWTSLEVPWCWAKSHGVAQRTKGSSSSRGAGTALLSPLEPPWHSPAFEAAVVGADAGGKNWGFGLFFFKGFIPLTAELESNLTVCWIQPFYFSFFEIRLCTLCTVKAGLSLTVRIKAFSFYISSFLQFKTLQPKWCQLQRPPGTAARAFTCCSLFQCLLMACRSEGNLWGFICLNESC